MRHLLSCTSIALLAFCAAPGSAQDMVVTAGSEDSPGMILPFDAPADGKYGTDFGSINVDGATRTSYVYISNTDTDTDLANGEVTVFGSHAADFSITVQPTPLLAPGSLTSVAITFNPSDVGERNALISIPTNDPDAGDSPFVFSVTGQGVNGFPVASPDLRVQPGGKWKAKYDKKTSDAVISGELIVTNWVDTPAGAATIQVFASENGFLNEDEAEKVITLTTKEITGQIFPEKPMKIKFKGTVPFLTGRLFFLIEPAAPHYDPFRSNNTADRAFGVTAP